MPSLTEHSSVSRVKMLCMADSGSGKTGGLSSLAEAGYKLFIQDYDDGLDPLRGFCPPEFHGNIHYVTLRDKLKGSRVGAEPVGIPDAFARGMLLLNNWKDPTSGEDFGPVSEWGPDRILVIDTLTSLGESMLRWSRMQNNRWNVLKREGKDYGTGQELQEEFLDLLMDDRIKCHIIVMSHISYQAAMGEAPKVMVGKEKDGTPILVNEDRGYPSALGKKLPPRIGRHFNTVIQARVELRNNKPKRIFRTISTPLIQLKMPFPPSVVPEELPLETGYADIFKVFKEHGVPAEESSAAEPPAVQPQAEEVS